MDQRGEIMEIWKHKKTGKWFIYLTDTVSDEAYFITPPNDLGKVSIKSLKLSIFGEDVEDDDAKTLLSKGMISEDQFDRYQTYKRDRVIERAENTAEIIKDWPEWKKKELIQELKAMKEESD